MKMWTLSTPYWSTTGTGSIRVATSACCIRVKMLDGQMYVTHVHSQLVIQAHDY